LITTSLCSPNNLKKTGSHPKGKIRMIRIIKRNKRFPCHLPSLREYATVVARKDTSPPIVEIKTRFPKMSGL
jgi:hypothetical protein